MFSLNTQRRNYIFKQATHPLGSFQWNYRLYRVYANITLTSCRHHRMLTRPAIHRWLLIYSVSLFPVLMTQSCYLIIFNLLKLKGSNLPQPSFNLQVHDICLPCQQEPCHFRSLCLPEVSSESLPSFSDSSLLHKAQAGVFTSPRVIFTEANRRCQVWTKVTCSNLGWQGAKGPGDMVST